MVYTSGLSEKEALDSQDQFTMKASGMSTKWFKEQFEPDCIENYGGARYLKIMHDHKLSSEFYPLIRKLQAQVEELKELLYDLKGEL